ncbi:MAG: hypothetical protein ABI543_04800 [Ignavibacteria bacterium]
MKTIFLVLLLLSISFHFVNGQDAKGDSLKTGRICKLILYNGYQTEGRIIERVNDTLKFQTDITNLFIPVKDIKFVLNPEVELSDLEDKDTLDLIRTYYIIEKIDTTEECNIYLDNKSELTGVKLIKDTDSTLKTVKNGRSKIISIAGIRKIVFKVSAPFGKGFFIGAAIGFVVGFVPFAFTKPEGHPSIGGFSLGLIMGFLCSIPGGLIGGVVGVLSASDDVYLFDNGITPVKIKRLHFAMEKHY